VVPLDIEFSSISENPVSIFRHEYLYGTPYLIAPRPPAAYLISDIMGYNTHLYRDER